MNPIEIINLINDKSANSTEIQGARVVYLPDDVMPIGIVARLRHIESGMKYDQIFRMKPLEAQAFANALLVQSRVADPPPSF
jgi:hypothetical protein